MARFLCFLQASKTCFSFFSSASLIIPITLSLIFIFFYTLFPKQMPSKLQIPEDNDESSHQELEKDTPVPAAKEENAPAVSHDLYSEIDTECSTASSEEDQYEWLYSGNMAWEDNSDDEGLIEIAIPSGQFVVSPEKDDRPIYLRCCSKVVTNKDLLAEEDNLIEIDIYMGSIKCSRFGIQPTTTTN